MGLSLESNRIVSAPGNIIEEGCLFQNYAECLQNLEPITRFPPFPIVASSSSSSSDESAEFCNLASMQGGGVSYEGPTRPGRDKGKAGPNSILESCVHQLG